MYYISRPNRIIENMMFRKFNHPHLDLPLPDSLFVYKNRPNKNYVCRSINITGMRRNEFPTRSDRLNGCRKDVGFHLVASVGITDAGLNGSFSFWNKLHKNAVWATLSFDTG